MRRKLVIVIVLLAILWGGLWYGVAALTRAGLDNWAEMRRAEGWTAAANSRTQNGFPLKVRTTIKGIELGHASTGFESRIPLLELTVPITKPFSQAIHLPAQTITLSRSGSRAEIVFDGADATAALKPGLMLELDRADLILAPWQITSPSGPVLGANGGYLAATQDAADDRVYHFDLSIDNLTAAPVLRDALNLPADWPEAFEALSGKLTVAFDRPLDRTSQPGNRPQPRRIHLRRSQIQWGAIDLSANADLTVDTNGIPQGELSIKAMNWAELLDIVEAASALSPAMRQQIEAAVGIIARMNGDTKTVDVDITFDRGRMSMGFIPLGPAPRIYLQ